MPAGRPRKKLTEQDFKGFKYEKIVNLPLRQKVLDVYPQLKKYPELHDKKFKKMRLSFDRILRYVILYYSDNILRQVIPEVAHRKKEAANIAGFYELKNTGQFSYDVEQMLRCQNPVINQLIIRFLRRSENKKFMQLCVFEEARAKQMQKLIDGVGDSDRELTKTVIDNVKTLSQDIEDLEKELLNEDDSRDLMEAMYDEIDYTNLGITPEEIAETIADGTTDKILKSPYKHKYDGSRNRAKKV